LSVKYEQAISIVFLKQIKGLSFPDMQNSPGNVAQMVIQSLQIGENIGKNQAGIQNPTRIPEVALELCIIAVTTRPARVDLILWWT